MITPDALDLAGDADRRYCEWLAARHRAERSGDSALAAEALRRFERYVLSVERADASAKTFALDGTGRWAG